MAVKKSIKEIIRDEYKRCSQDPVHFMRKYCIIQHPTKGKMYFNLYPFQEDTLSQLKDNRYNKRGRETKRKTKKKICKTM